MRKQLLAQSLAHAAKRVPGARRLPVLKLLAAGELALIARDHVRRLTPTERRRLAALVRLGRGRRNRLTTAEQAELERLLDKLQARRLAGETVDRLSPIPLPKRLLYGPRSAR